MMIFGGKLVEIDYDRGPHDLFTRKSVNNDDDKSSHGVIKSKKNNERLTIQLQGNTKFVNGNTFTYYLL